MKFANDFRSIARTALTGKWWLAVAAGLVASLLGGISSEGIKFEIKFNQGDGFTFSYAGQQITLDVKLISLITGAVLTMIVLSLIIFAVRFIIGSFVGVGYARFNLNLIDGRDAGFDSLFAYFSYWKTAAVTKLLRFLYIFLWSLLLIIPGIIASYSYAMTDYILAENPNLSPSTAIEKSKAMMSGNRWRLFCLHFSFIGWDILASITFGIGYLWLTPYKQAATAAFYRDVCFIEGGTSNREPAIETSFEETSANNDSQNSTQE